MCQRLRDFDKGAYVCTLDEVFLLADRVSVGRPNHLVTQEGVSTQVHL